MAPQFKNQSGFSLLELLIYMGLLAGIMMVIMNIFVIFSVNSASQESRTEVQQNLDFALKQIASSVRNQSDVALININANADILDLVSNSGEILLRFDATDSTLKKTVGTSGATCNPSDSCKIDCGTPDTDCASSTLLTSNVSLLPSNPPNDAIFKKIGDTIQIKLNISYNDNGRRDYIFQKTGLTSVSLR